MPNYLTILDRLHEQRRPRTYVEIGVKHGRSLLRAGPETRCIGIDPHPRLERVPRNVTIFPETSDEFFASHDLGELLGGPVDLAFIDGLHTFEAALRDFVNLERHCTRGSVIAFHDVYPDRDDVWKAIVALRQYRPDLHVAVVAVPPSGLALVTRLDPSSRVLEERFDESLRELADLEYRREVLDPQPPTTIDLAAPID